MGPNNNTNYDEVEKRLLDIRKFLKFQRMCAKAKEDYVFKHRIARDPQPIIVRNKYTQEEIDVEVYFFIIRGEGVIA